MCLQVVDGELGGGGYGDEVVRHAETPELAREALADSAALIFKGQVPRRLPLCLSMLLLHAIASCCIAYSAAFF